MVGSIKLNDNDFIYSVRDNTITLYHNDPTLIDCLFKDFSEQTLVGHPFGSGIDMFMGCRIIRCSLFKVNSLTLSYDILIKCNQPFPKISSLDIEGRAIDYFFCPSVFKETNAVDADVALIAHSPASSPFPFQWRNLPLSISHEVSIKKSRSQSNPISSKSHCSVFSPSPLSLDDALDLVESIRRFFVFLYNTNSVLLKVSGINSDFNSTVEIHFVNNRDDKFFVAEEFEQYSSYFPSWAESLTSFLPLDYDTSHIPISSEYQYSPSVLYPKLLLFEKLWRENGELEKYPVFNEIRQQTKEYVRSLKDVAPTCDVEYYDIFIEDLGKFDFVPRLKARIKSQLNKHSHWIDNLLSLLQSKYKFEVPMSIESIADTCHRLRNSYSHSAKSSFSDPKDFFSLAILNEVVYCMVLDLIKASSEKYRQLLKRIFIL